MHRNKPWTANLDTDQRWKKNGHRKFFTECVPYREFAFKHEEFVITQARLSRLPLQCHTIDTWIGLGSIRSLVCHKSRTLCYPREGRQPSPPFRAHRINASAVNTSKASSVQYKCYRIEQNNDNNGTGNQTPIHPVQNTQWHTIWHP
jgi:hypothetical protein